jgi:hypothetical protein
MKMIFKNCVPLIFIKGVTKDGVETSAPEPSNTNRLWRKGEARKGD